MYRYVSSISLVFRAVPYDVDMRVAAAEYAYSPTGDLACNT